MSRVGLDYQAVLPKLGPPILLGTEEVAGVRDDPRSAKQLSHYCRLDIGTFVLVRDRGWGIIVQGDYSSKFTVEFEDNIAGITTTGVYECGPYEDDAPTEIEAFRTSNEWGERYYWTRHEVRKEFSPWRWKEYGEIHYSPTPRDRRNRIEFAKGHKSHGQIQYYDGGVDKLTRIEHTKDHKFSNGKSGHGQIRYYDGRADKLTRIEYTKDHKLSDGTSGHGQIQFYDGSPNKLIRVEFAEHNNHHGHIRHYRGGKIIRKEYAKGHPMHGEVWHYDGSLDKRTHIEFFNDEVVWYYDGSHDTHTRIEYAKEHPFHGEIRHFENAKLTKIDFPDGRSFVPEEKKRKVLEVIVVEE